VVSLLVVRLLHSPAREKAVFGNFGICGFGKAFDWVPRMVLCWALRYVNVEKWIVDVIKSMCASGVTTAVKLKNGVTKEVK